VVDSADDGLSNSEIPPTFVVNLRNSQKAYGLRKASSFQKFLGVGSGRDDHHFAPGTLQAFPAQFGVNSIGRSFSEPTSANLLVNQFARFTPENVAAPPTKECVKLEFASMKWELKRFASKFSRDNPTGKFPLARFYRTSESPDDLSANSTTVEAFVEEISVLETTVQIPENTVGLVGGIDRPIYGKITTASQPAKLDGIVKTDWTEKANSQAHISANIVGLVRQDDLLNLGRITMKEIKEAGMIAYNLIFCGDPKLGTTRCIPFRDLPTQSEIVKMMLEDEFVGYTLSYQPIGVFKLRQLIRENGIPGLSFGSLSHLLG